MDYITKLYKNRAETLMEEVKRLESVLESMTLPNQDEDRIAKMREQQRKQREEEAAKKREQDAAKLSVKSSEGSTTTASSEPNAGELNYEELRKAETTNATTDIINPLIRAPLYGALAYASLPRGTSPVKDNGQIQPRTFGYNEKPVVGDAPKIIAPDDSQPMSGRHGYSVKTDNPSVTTSGTQSGLNPFKMGSANQAGANVTAAAAQRSAEVQTGRLQSMASMENQLFDTLPITDPNHPINRMDPNTKITPEIAVANQSAAERHAQAVKAGTWRGRAVTAIPGLIGLGISVPEMFKDWREGRPPGALDTAAAGLSALQVATALRRNPAITAAAQGGVRAAASGAARTVARRVERYIPLAGLALGLGYAAQRAEAGDEEGANLETASTITSQFPGLGTAASLGIDTYLTTRDEAAAEEAAKVPAEFRHSTQQTGAAPGSLDRRTNVGGLQAQGMSREDANFAMNPSGAPTPTAARDKLKADRIAAAVSRMRSMAQGGMAGKI